MASQNNVSIAILDDYADTAPKHMASIPQLREVAYFPNTLNPSKQDDLETLVGQLQPYTIISTMRERTPFPAELQRRLPNLKLLLTTGMRNASIDISSAAELGIIVTGTKGDRPSQSTKDPSAPPGDKHDHPDSTAAPAPQPPPGGFSAVVQHTWALLLSLCGRIPRDDRAVKASTAAWQSGLGVSLAGKTLGVVGLGKLGLGMARIGRTAFGMKVIAWSENLTQEKADAVVGEVKGMGTGSVLVVSKEELFRCADVVSLHLVLSERSRGVVGQGELAKMKKTGMLVNSSRGGLINEDALTQAVREGTIGGVALDVFWEEPLPADSPWRSVDSWAQSEVVLSPHMGYVNEETMDCWYEEQAEIVKLYLRSGEVRNRIN